ncbi:aldo/keto reductase [Candidatus Phycosocius spiralis]|uniref:Oxidoreductase n=1 Tax=Candidatus Phycosocius spiralis TaxID=2815099 RepID=A0ABQ4PSE2_9PROT|nr:aldo/keto reductase [Candidatus Phycosocius spiralis]GIU65924.1 oxidoreductase [Candidatus Phycosocius spiralis]
MTMSHVFDLVPLGKTGISVSSLGWGMWRFAGTPPLAARKIVETVFEAGINLFDTADVYGYRGLHGFGDAEALLGAVIKEAPSLRQSMILASKSGITPPTPYNSSFAYLVQACEASLRRLNTDYLDLWQIHRPDLLTHPAEIAKAVDNLMQAGKIRAFGISNFTPSQTRALVSYLSIDIASFQPEFSPLALDALSDGTLDLAIELGASVLAWSPLAGGKLAKNGEDARSKAVIAALDHVAQTHRVSRNSVAYAWVKAHPSRPIALIGTQNPDRILETRQVSTFNLSPIEWYQILVASRGAPMP